MAKWNEKHTRLQEEYELQGNQYEEKCAELNQRIEELKVAVMSTPARRVSGNDKQLEPTWAGRSYTEIYAEYIRMEDELIGERNESRRLSEALESILTDVEQRVRVLLMI